MPSSARSNKESQLLFSPDPAGFERTIRKEASSLSIDNNNSVSLDYAQPPSTQTPVPSTDSRSPLSSDSTKLPSTNNLYPTSIDFPSRTSIDTEPRAMVALLILVRDNNGDLHDQEGHLRTTLPVDEAAQPMTLADYNRPDRYYTNRSAILPPTIERDFELKAQYYTLVGQLPYHGLSHEHPMDHLESSYYQKPPPPTQESKIEEMLDRVLEAQQRITVDFNGNIDSVYTNLNTKFETLSSHVKKMEILVVQTGDAIRRQEASTSGVRDDVMKQHVNAIIEDDFWQVVKEEKLQEGDFEVESLMSFGVPEHRSTTSTESTASCNAVKILTHEEFAAKHPHPPSPNNVRIDRHANSNVDRYSEANIDRQPSPPID
uniref:Uncharacterized protein n=1 Tax=Brassica oleracea var. oleracea TaxID=109376 RepID=A0A0D2ZSC0_BRAOL